MTEWFGFISDGIGYADAVSIDVSCSGAAILDACAGETSTSFDDDASVDAEPERLSSSNGIHSATVSSAI